MDSTKTIPFAFILLAIALGVLTVSLRLKETNEHLASISKSCSDRAK